MDFVSSFTPPQQVSDTDLVFAVRDKEILTQFVEGQVSIPCYRPLRDRLPVDAVQYLGMLNRIHCYAGTVSAEAVLPDAFRFTPLRTLYGRIDEGLFWTAARAMHLVNWDLSSRFCSACGKQTTMKDNERAKVCTGCDRVTYPPISPAIITAIVKDDRLLLLDHQRSPTPLFTLLAGFVEPGETLEQCVMREAHEEAGISIRNIQYFGSQPWAFSNSLMVGFTAEYAGGALQFQASEIRDGGWFRASDLPRVNPLSGKPPHCSIAWHMIKWFEEHYR